MRHRQLLVDVLLNCERGDQIERDPGDDAEGTERDDRTEESICIPVTRECFQISIGGDHFQSGDCSCQVAVPVTRAVGRAHASADDRNVVKRSCVSQSIASRVQLRAKLAIGDSCVDSGSVPLAVDDQVVIETAQGDQIARRIGNVIEAVTGPDDTNLVRIANSLSHTSHCRWLMKPGRVEGRVA